MDLEKITKLLNPGEQILWASMSQPGKLMDGKNRRRNRRWFVSVGAVFALLMFFYVRACVRAGTNVFSVVTLVFVLVAGIIFLDPVTTFHKLKKVEYAITTDRVIVCSSTASSFSLPRSKAATVQVIDEEGGVSTLIIGTKKSVKPGKLRQYGLTGLFVTENEKDVPYPVFYRVSDAKEAVRILEASGN